MIIEAKSGVISVIPISKKTGEPMKVIIADFPYPKRKDILEKSTEELRDLCCPEGVYSYEYKKLIKGFKFSFVADPVYIEHGYKSRIEKAFDRAVNEVYRCRGTKGTIEKIKDEMMGVDDGD